jgi:predicted Zn-dependent protease
MYAKCDYKLETALNWSARAVELSPTSAVYLDTLAEIQFRMGNVTQAIESMRGCIKLDPRGSHYRANLVRFRAAQM